MVERMSFKALAGTLGEAECEPVIKQPYPDEVTQKKYTRCFISLHQNFFGDFRDFVRCFS